jgi:hypothetical protein
MGRSSDRINWTERQLNARLAISSIVGHAAAYEAAEKYFKQRAGQLFADGKDVLASFCRDQIAPEMKKNGQDYRKQQKELQAAYDEEFKD